MFALILFSLVGLPPLAGFLGKFAIFASLADGWKQTGNVYLLVLLVLGGLNTAISLFYYLRVVKVMTIDPGARFQSRRVVRPVPGGDLCGDLGDSDRHVAGLRQYAQRFDASGSTTVVLREWEWRSRQRLTS